MAVLLVPVVEKRKASRPNAELLIPVEVSAIPARYPNRVPEVAPASIRPACVPHTLNRKSCGLLVPIKSVAPAVFPPINHALAAIGVCQVASPVASEVSTFPVPGDPPRTCMRPVTKVAVAPVPATTFVTLPFPSCIVLPVVTLAPNPMAVALLMLLDAIVKAPNAVQFDPPVWF